jgi:S1-C subfamily serine protease
MLTTLLFASALAAPPTNADWEATLDRVVPAVVSIRVTATRDFDTESASNSQGTGFIVDAERGLLLTNRHMVHDGPVVADAVLIDNEQIDLQPIYRDPVHDFGFYRFDPSQVEHMELSQLTLDAEGARVGAEIRVVGNDAGEKISILDGTLARLDRNAPHYGGNTYNDFNTFYIQAASNTSGGSSGSPVVNVDGHVVALNAGGNTGAASSFYLPLPRVVRAFEKLQAGEPVTRGTLQSVLTHVPFDELRLLGLQPDTERQLRALPSGPNGMLVVSEVVPGGPADGQLQPGDIVVRLNGEPLLDFVQLESVLDEAVGDSVTMSVERGGRPLDVKVTVDDLHAISPSSYLEVGRGVLHDLSYHQARNHHRPVSGVYLAVSGYMWAAGDVPSGAVVSHIDGEAVDDLDAMQALLETKADGQRLRVRFDMVGDPRRSYETVVTMDRTWFEMQRCTRDADGDWPCVDSPPPPELQPTPARAGALLTAEGDDRVSRKLAKALVIVEFDVPYASAGVKDFNYVGVGTVVDAEQGLVIVDRDTVPVALGDMTVTFGGTVRVPGTLRWLHPVHNWAVVQYDPDLVAGLDVSEATFVDVDLAEGDKVFQVGLNRAQELITSKGEVDWVEALTLGASGTPRYRDFNVEGAWVDGIESSLGGVIANKKGEVVGLWASFLDQRDDERAFYALPGRFILPMLEKVLAGQLPSYRAPGFEVGALDLVSARERGLSDGRIRQILAHDPDRRQVLEIRRVHGDAPSTGQVRQADMLLEVNGRIVTRMRQLEAATARPELELVVLRDGEEKTVRFETLALDGTGVDRVLSWAGLLLHEPHVEVAAQWGFPARGVYVAWQWYGSPASRYGVRPTRRIVAVDDTPIDTLDDFLAAVRGKPDRTAVRLTLEKFDGSTSVEALRLDLAYWPTQLFERDDDGEWTRTEIDE